jgi:hypothetical protein
LEPIEQTPRLADSLVRLRRFASVRPAERPVERCALCSDALSEEHPHVVDLQTGELACCCSPCALLFGNQAHARYRTVPDNCTVYPNFQMSDEQWENLSIPVGLAFFFHSSKSGLTRAVYPSPAGPMDSLLPLDAWQEIVAQNPALHELVPDVEAILVNRVREARDVFRVPLDECYKLIGLIRMKWRGISGGSEVWDETRRFFESLNQRARVHA